MRFITVDTYESMSKIAANIIAAQIVLKPNSVLGLATGSTPIGTYEQLALKCSSGDVDFSNVTSVNLDEYVGLPEENDQSYRYFMNKNLFSNININYDNTFVPNGCASDLLEECEAYDERIKKMNGIDIQLLGIGVDGHIGFNEPCDVFVKETHTVDLDESTIEANSRFFASKNDVPKRAVTMGMGAIMSAKKILLIANGANKADILDQALYGPITPHVPASILQLHNDVTVIYSKK